MHIQEPSVSYSGLCAWLAQYDDLEWTRYSGARLPQVVTMMLKTFGKTVHEIGRDVIAERNRITSIQARQTQELDHKGQPMCPKCSYVSGDDWSQCHGSCPMPGSPHFGKQQVYQPKDSPREALDPDQEIPY